MWAKTGFTAGTYTTNSDENPYIDYTGGTPGYYGLTRDYSIFDASGISKSLSYTTANDDYYDGGTLTITGTYKWLLISHTKANSNVFGDVVINGTGGSTNPLTLGTDYLLYFQEIDSYFSPGTSIPVGYASGRSGWKAVHGTWDQGATVILNNSNEAGAYRRYTSGGQAANYNIALYSTINDIQIFYRIGLKNGSNIKISNVTISYGTS